MIGSFKVRVPLYNLFRRDARDDMARSDRSQKAPGAIYYKGFLSLTMGLHLYASGDKKYNNGFSVVNDGEHTFPYTHTSMNEYISQQWCGRTEGSH